MNLQPSHSSHSVIPANAGIPLDSTPPALNMRLAPAQPRFNYHSIAGLPAK